MGMKGKQTKRGISLLLCLTLLVSMLGGRNRQHCGYRR